LITGAYAIGGNNTDSDSNFDNH